MKSWGGRFSDSTSPLLERFNASIGFDYKLYKEDIEGSIAHAKMLHKMDILTFSECETIIWALNHIGEQINNGEATFKVQDEDIHMNIESMLIAQIGPLGKKLHTGRSRNDQVALDLKLYTRKSVDEITKHILKLMQSLLEISKQHIETIMPGYTHLQRAQPIRLAFHLMAYYEMLKRDLSRYLDLYARMDEMPLGSGALAGVNYPSDRGYLSSELGFKKATENAMDAVSDRDYAIEFCSAASILMMHLSRFSEELVMWSSSEYKFCEMSDAFTTGSSIMPQKKNPDAAELVRGKTGRVYGNLMGLLTVMKGLPLAYNKDMQEDKEGVFDTSETIILCLEVFNALLNETTFNVDQMRNAAVEGFLNATDFADYLVQKGLPFRESHEVTGKLVAYCVTHQTVIEKLPLSVLKQFCSSVETDVYDVLELESVIENKKTYGSTSKASVLHHIQLGEQYVSAFENKPLNQIGGLI